MTKKPTEKFTPPMWGIDWLHWTYLQDFNNDMN